MKTTFDLPADLLERSKIAAAKRRTTLKKLVIEGLETVLVSDASTTSPDEAIERLKRGLHLGGKTLTRNEIHVR